MSSFQEKMTFFCPFEEISPYFKLRMETLSCSFRSFYFPTFYQVNHSRKKRKDSLEGIVDRVLFAAELEFPKILVPSLP